MFVFAVLGSLLTQVQAEQLSVHSANVTSLASSINNTAVSSGSTKGVADYVLSGLGPDGSTTNPTRTHSGTSTSIPTHSQLALATSKAPFNNISTTTTGASSSLGSRSSWTNARETTSAISPFDNLTYTGDCWARWNQYWSASSSFSIADLSFSWTTFTTLATERLISVSGIEETYPVETMTVVVSDGSFVLDTYTTVTTLPWTGEDLTAWPTATITTLETLATFSQVSAFPNATITPPPCTLPSIVPQCQSSWEIWVASWGENDQPICPLASLSGSLCSQLATDVLENLAEYDGGAVSSVVLMTTDGITSTSSYWPANMSFAPGCSLGCKGCQITGGTVQLLFWMPETASANMSTQQNAAFVTAVAMGTTFTSPTVYISFDRLYASDSCGPVGPTITNTIVPITNISGFSSLWGAYNRVNGLGLSASFNFTDLYSTPVPDEIYQSQPRCANSLSMLQGLGPPVPANWTCPRTLPYAPIISMPADLRSLHPQWALCSGGIGGGYDPPTALQPVASVPSPTMPSTIAVVTTTAEPASSPSPSAAPNTASETSSAPRTTETVSPSVLSTESDIGSPTNTAPSQDSTRSIVTFASLSFSFEPSAMPSDDGNGGQSASMNSNPAVSDLPAASDPVGETAASGTTNALTILSQAEESFALSTNKGDMSSSTHISVSFDSSSPGNVVVAGQTLSVGGPATTVDSIELSAAFGGSLVVGSSTIEVPTQGTIIPLQAGQSQGSVVLGSQTFTYVRESQSAAVLADGSMTITLNYGGPGSTVGNQVVSAISDEIVISSGSSLLTIPVDPPAYVTDALTIDSQSYSAIVQTGGNVILDSPSTTITLLPGESATNVGSETVSAASGGIVVVGDTTFTIASPGSATAGTELLKSVVLGSQTFTEIVQSDGIEVFADPHTTFTLTAGGPAVTIQGQVISGAEGSGVVVGSQTVYPGPSESGLTSDGQHMTVSADGSGHEVIAFGSSTTTLSAGGPGVTVGSGVLSVASNRFVTATPATISPDSASSQTGSSGDSSKATTTTSAAARSWCLNSVWVIGGFAWTMTMLA